MKILIISHLYPSPVNNIYGIFVHKQVLSLYKKGIDIIVISPRPFVPPFFKNFKKKWLEYSNTPYYKYYNGIPVHYPRYFSLPFKKIYHIYTKLYYLYSKKIIKEILSYTKIDLIHAHVACPDGYVANKIYELFNIPFVLTVHGYDFYQTIYKNYICRNYIKNILNNANYVVVVSSKLKQIAEVELNIKRKIEVIANGYSTYNGNTVEYDQKFIKNKNHDIIILSVSTLIKRKKIDLNIKAIRNLKQKIPNIKYLIVGEGNERDQLEKLVRKYCLQKNVFFLGRLDNKEVLKLMENVTIFSLPSINESFGVVYLEAMAHGIPIIACKGEGIEDVIKDGTNGFLVEPNNVIELTNKMLYIINNPKKIIKICKKAYKLVTENYSWNNNAKKYKNIYMKIINESTLKRL